MSTSSTKDTTGTQNTNPWGPQASALTSAFANANTAYGKSSQAVAPTNFTAQMTPDQLATFNTMVQQGGNQAVPISQRYTGDALQTAGTAGTAGALSGLGNYNPTTNNSTAANITGANQMVAGENIPAQVAQAMQGANETARDVTMPGIEQNAAIGGNTNSSRTGVADGIVQRGLAEQTANMTGALSSTAYQNALAQEEAQNSANNNSTVGALSAEGSLGNTAAATGVNAGTASIANQNSLDSTAVAGGAGEQAANQANLTNEQQQYAAQTQDPYASLQGLMGIIGSQNWGSQGNSTSNTTSTPSIFDTISGLLSSAGSAAKGIGAISDRRLKQDIVRVGTLDNGLPIYTYRYIGEARVNLGVMAQDVELVNPEAVLDAGGGFKAVNYQLACANG